MSFCINPQCSKPLNSRQPLFCESCGSDLLLDGRYRVIERLGRGGFADTYEVFEFGTPMVLKVLHHEEPKALELFKREFDVLSRLNHPGIPKVDLDAYFTFMPKSSSEVLHCFVMEKIEGMDLERYMEGRGGQPISEKTALNWLKQILEILQIIHDQNFLHRDIKPSNIVLKPDGQLALIDFGAVREMSQTYMQKSKITAISSAGYTPPEQVNGKATKQSDFFALGRTFVFLVTGKELAAFNLDPQTAELIWHNDAKHISEDATRILDWLMNYIPKNRPENSSEILGKLDSALMSANSTHPKTNQTKPNRSKSTASYQTPTQTQYAGFWTRVGASFVDAIILFVISFIIYSFFGIPFDLTISENSTDEELIGFISWFLGSSSLDIFLDFMYCSILLSSSLKGTLGKKLLGIIVVDRNGEKISFARASLRFFSGILPILTLGIGYLTVFFDKEKRALHDMVSGTKVVIRRN